MVRLIVIQPLQSTKQQMHRIRIRNNDIDLYKILGENNPADLLTKAEIPKDIPYLFISSVAQQGLFEQRFFWPESTAIVLHGMPESSLWLSCYQFEIHKDNYLLLEDESNIKFRKKKLHIKPLIKMEDGVAQ